MDILLHVVHILAALALIALILLQQGKGADAGASFGGGASQTVLGAAGAASFLTRATAILAVVFMLTSLALAWKARQESTMVEDLGLGELETVEQVQPVDETVPQLEIEPVEESSVPAFEEATAEAVEGAEAPEGAQ